MNLAQMEKLRQCSPDNDNVSKIEPSTRRVVVEETIAEPKDFEQVLKTTTKQIINKQATRTHNFLKTNKQA